MSDFFAWVKKHPLIVVLGIGVVILVVVLFSSSGNSTQATTTTDPNAAAEIAAQTQLQQAAIAAGAANYQVSAQQDVSNNQTAAQVAIAQLSANVQQYQTQQQSVVAQANTAASENVGLAGIQSQVDLANIAAQNQAAQIQASVNQAQITANTYDYIANEQAQVQIAQYGDAAAVAIAPYATVQDLYSTIGGDNLTKILYGAEGTKGSSIVLPGVSAGRVGSGGGQINGMTFNASSNPFSGLFSSVANVNYGSSIFGI